MENSKRQIKFRAWDGKQFYYTPDFNMHFSESGIIAGLHNGGMVFNRDGEITQFTGLLDKNGKEIYEGDWVMADGTCNITGAFDPHSVISKWRKWRVVFKDGGFIIKGKSKRAKEHRLRGVTIRQNGINVIVNIYENPEPLK